MTQPTRDTWEHICNIKQPIDQSGDIAHQKQQSIKHAMNAGMPTHETWRERFEKKFNGRLKYPELYVFIQTELDAAREEAEDIGYSIGHTEVLNLQNDVRLQERQRVIEKLKGMKKPKLESALKSYVLRREAWNAAIDQAIKEIENED